MAATSEYSTVIMSTTNSTEVDYDYEEEGLISQSLTWLIVVGIVYILIIIVTLIGNAFVMAAYAVDDRIRSRPSNILIVNLSISDFLVGITLIFNYIFLLYDAWPLGEIPCKLWIVLDYTCSFMSVITITLISLDRYWMVKKKLGYRTYQTKKRIMVTLIICWSVVVTFYTITAFGYGAMTNTNYVDFSDDCEMEYLYDLPFSAVMIVVEFVIPFIIILYLNIVVYMNIQMRTGDLVRSKPDKGPQISSKASMDTEKSLGTDSASGLAFTSSPLYSKTPVPIVTISYTSKGVPAPNGFTETAKVDNGMEQSKSSDEGIVPGNTNISPDGNGVTNPVVDVNDFDIATDMTDGQRQVEQNGENTNNNANHGMKGSNDGTSYSNDSRLKLDVKTRPVSDVSFCSVASDASTTLARANKEQSKNIKKKAREFRRQRRAAIVLFTLVIAFAICWLPYQITTILTTLMGDGSVHWIVEEVMTNLLWCNSTINPFLYAFVTVSFRRNFIRFLGLHRVTWCQKKSTSEETQDRINTSDPTECDS